MYNELRNLNTILSSNTGYVYILYNTESNLVKIGSTQNPHERLSKLTNESGTKLKYYITQPMYIFQLVEKVMLQKYDRFRVKGEWLKGVEFDRVVNQLKEICDSEDFKRRNISKDIKQ